MGERHGLHRPKVDMRKQDLWLKSFVKLCDGFASGYVLSDWGSVIQKLGRGFDLESGLCRAKPSIPEQTACALNTVDKYSSVVQTIPCKVPIA
jgi:hypothetical protein